MSVGLDVGSFGVRCLRRCDEQLIGRASRAVFAVVPDAPEYRALLDAGCVPFATCEGALTLVGDFACAY